MARAALVLPCRGELGSAVEDALLAHTESWARGVAGDGVAVAPAGLGVAEAAHELLPGYPLLVVWACLARLGSEHARAALGDLEAGCDLVLGPALDGGLYLLALGRRLDGVLEAFSPPTGQEDSVSLVARIAAEREIDLGLLRAERTLRTAADAAAVLADPLTPPEIVGLLRAR